VTIEATRSAAAPTSATTSQSVGMTARC
jgi:hypothetical protein